MKYESNGVTRAAMKKSKALADVMMGANMPIKFMNNGCLVM